MISFYECKNNSDFNDNFAFSRTEDVQIGPKAFKLKLVLLLFCEHQRLPPISLKNIIQYCTSLVVSHKLLLPLREVVDDLSILDTYL